MIWDRRLHALVPRNPIFMREIVHRERRLPYWIRFMDSVGAVALGLGFSVAMLLAVVFRSNLGPYYYKDQHIVLIQIFAWIFHVLAVLRMLIAGASAATADSHLLSSDDLMVTPLTNWQILAGKWWSAMYRMRGWFLALGIVQVGTVVSTAFGLHFVLNISSCRYPCIYNLDSLAFDAPWFIPIHQVSLIAGALGITILETMCCTALGMACVVLFRSKLGLLCAIAVRFLPLLIFSVYPDYPSAPPNNVLTRYIFYTSFSFADSGTGALIQLADSTTTRHLSFRRGVRGVSVALAMFAAYFVASVVVLWVVMRLSRR
jgi:hypothetical protein